MKPYRETYEATLREPSRRELEEILLGEYVEYDWEIPHTPLAYYTVMNTIQRFTGVKL